MKFIYVNGLVINCDHIVFFTQNKVSGDVVVMMTITKLDLAFPHGSEFVRQFEELHLALPLPKVLES